MHRSAMFGFGKNLRDPLADVKSAERWLASFPTNDPLAIHGEVLARARSHRGADRHAARRSGSRRCSTSTPSARALRKSLTVAIHRARDAQLEDRASAVVGAVRPHAGVPRRVLRVRARSVAPRAKPEVAAAAARAPVPADRAHGPRRQDPALPVRAVDPGQVGGAAWARSRSRARASSSARSCRAAPGGSSTTIEHEYLVALLLQLMNAGNMTARHLEWVAGELDEWCAPLRLSLEPSSVTSFYVDLGSRDGLRRRTPAPLEGRVLFLDTRPAAFDAHAERRDARAEDQGRSRCPSARPSAPSSSGLLTKLASQVDPEFKPFARRGERTAAAGTVDAIVGFAKISGFLREEEQRHRSPIAETRQELRRHDGARGVRTHAQRRRPPHRAVATALRAVRGARRTVGSQGREPDRLPPARADERGQYGHAGHADRDPAAGPDAVDARHRAPHEADDGRPRGDRPAGDRQHARRRRPRRAAQGRPTTTTRSTARPPRSTAARSTACSSRCASAKAIPPCSRSWCPPPSTSPPSG